MFKSLWNYLTNNLNERFPWLVLSFAFLKNRYLGLLGEALLAQTETFNLMYMYVYVHMYVYVYVQSHRPILVYFYVFLAK